MSLIAFSVVSIFTRADAVKTSFRRQFKHHVALLSSGQYSTLSLASLWLICRSLTTKRFSRARLLESSAKTGSYVDSRHADNSSRSVCRKLSEVVKTRILVSRWVGVLTELADRITRYLLQQITTVLMLTS